MNIIPREFIELVLARIDIVDLINIHLPLRKKSSNNFFARCPFHSEKSASFSVSQNKQFYHCFGCGAHGNAIDFLMQHDHLPFKEAVLSLAKQVGLEVPQSVVGQQRQDSFDELYQFMARAAAFYYEQMRQSPRAINYLKERGISGSIAQQFMIGFAPAGWNNISEHLAKAPQDIYKLTEIGLCIKKQEGGTYDRFRDRIMFPIHDYRGRIIGFGGRILDQGEPKYLNSPETPLFQKGHELYGLHQVLKCHRHPERIIVVEGYMDVIALFQHDVTYAVATLGTATTREHLKRLYRYTTEIVFCFDGDQAGRAAAWRALEVIFPNMQDGIQIRFLFLPEQEDPDSYIRKVGKAAFAEQIQTASSLSAFFFQNLHQQCDITTIEGRARFAALALAYIKQVPDGILQGIFLAELSQRARIDAQELKRQLPQADKTSAPQQLKPTNTITTVSKQKLNSPMKLALALLVQAPELASNFTNPLPITDMPGYNFFNELLEIIKSHPNINTGTLIERFRGHPEEGFIATLAQYAHMIPFDGIEKEFQGTIRQLLTLCIDEEIDRLLAKAQAASLTADDKIQLTQWIAKKKAL